MNGKREEMDIVLTGRNETAATFAAVKRDLSSLSGIARQSSAVLGLVGASLSLTGVASYSRDAIKSLSDIADEADRVKVSTAALQTLQFHLKAAGGVSEDAATALTKFGKAAAEAATGNNELAKFLEKNGVALKDQNGTIRSAETLLQDYARLVAGAGSQQEKLMLASDVFGREVGPKMVEALELIARRGLPALIDEATKAGQVVDDALVRKADEIDKAWNKMVDSVSNRMKGFVVETIQAGEELAKLAGKASDKLAPREAAMMQQRRADSRSLLGFGKPAPGDVIPTLPEGSVFESTAGRGSADRDDPLRRELAAPLPKTNTDRSDTKERERLEKRLVALKAMLASEDEALRVHHEQQIKQIEEFEAKQIGTAEQRNALKLASEDRYQQAVSNLIFTKFDQATMTEGELLAHRHEQLLAQLEQFEATRTDQAAEWAERRRKIEEKYSTDVAKLQSQRFSTMAGDITSALGSMTQIMGAEGDKQIGIQKGISAAIAAINVAEGITKALTLPFPLNWTQAAAVAAAGVAQLQAISRMGKSSGAPSVSGGGGGGWGGGSAPAPGGGSAEGASSRTIVIEGFGRNKRWTDDEVRELYGRIEEWRRDGDIVTWRT